MKYAIDVLQKELRQCIQHMHWQIGYRNFDTALMWCERCEQLTKAIQVLMKQQKNEDN